MPVSKGEPGGGAIPHSAQVASRCLLLESYDTPEQTALLMIKLQLPGGSSPQSDLTSPID